MFVSYTMNAVEKILFVNFVFLSISDLPLKSKSRLFSVQHFFFNIFKKCIEFHLVLGTVGGTKNTMVKICMALALKPCLLFVLRAEWMHCDSTYNKNKHNGMEVLGSETYFVLSIRRDIIASDIRRLITLGVRGEGGHVPGRGNNLNVKGSVEDSGMLQTSWLEHKIETVE